MAVVAHATHEQVNFAIRLNFCFVLAAFFVDVWRITIQQIDVFAWNINVVKEVFVHEGMIALRVFLRQTNIFIHIEGNNVLKANLACFMHGD
ncbi:hypothetical protein D3C80_1687170 [compost metagenome]